MHASASLEGIHRAQQRLAKENVENVKPFWEGDPEWEAMNGNPQKQIAIKVKGFIHSNIRKRVSRKKELDFKDGLFNDERQMWSMMMSNSSDDRAVIRQSINRESERQMWELMMSNAVGDKEEATISREAKEAADRQLIQVPDKAQALRMRKELHRRAYVSQLGGSDSRVPPASRMRLRLAGSVARRISMVIPEGPFAAFTDEGNTMLPSLKFASKAVLASHMERDKKQIQAYGGTRQILKYTHLPPLLPAGRVIPIRTRVRVRARARVQGW